MLPPASKPDRTTASTTSIPSIADGAIVNNGRRRATHVYQATKTKNAVMEMFAKRETRHDTRSS